MTVHTIATLDLARVVSIGAEAQLDHLEAAFDAALALGLPLQLSSASDAVLVSSMSFLSALALAYDLQPCWRYLRRTAWRLEATGT